MRINNNIMAMNTNRQLGINNMAGAKSLEKLSSGYRINRAGDDAAGLSISEKMRGQIRGLKMASRN
ncbi:MAG: flagellin, partial [Clostridiales bacterium]|nr:flagellin [Clostridiales bacterium]